MKKLKYLVFSILALVGTLIGITNVNAEEYKGSIKSNGYISGPYYYMHVEGTHRLWDQVNEIIRTSDGERVYCIQPFAKISQKGTYQVTSEDVEQVLNLEFDDWKLISKIAYYGWDYRDDTHDHRDDKWYVATQMLLWKIVTPNIDSYFTNTLKGERNDSILKQEMDEIMDLVNNHLVRPNFVGIPDKMVVNQSVTISDSRNVLDRYDLVNISGGEVTKSGNNITITAKKVGNISFSLQKLGNRYGEPTKVYYAVDYQNALHKGNIDPININFNVPVYGGDITIEKTDSDTYEQKAQGEASLAGAIYGVYKEDGTKVGTITTGEDGRATSDYLPTLGKFYVQEEKASIGYELDKNKYYFDVTPDNLHPDIQVFEKIIERTYDITKVYADSETSIMTPEPNVKFGFYNNKNELVKELITDSQGSIKVTLPYGTYTVKQLTTTQGYEKIKDFTIKVSTSGDNIRMVISNAEITAKLKVVKIDAETGNVIKKSNIKFRIVDAKTGKYVKQTITYPQAKTIEVFETDSNGILITPYPLNQGTYYLEEVDQAINGYLWNSKSLEFTIDGTSKLIEDIEYGVLYEAKFPNKPVKGNIIINKKGEKITFEEDGYTYDYINLEGVKFGLYALEDIYDGTGIKKFSKDDLVEVGVTNSEGKLVFDNLYLGKYYIKELETKEIYSLKEDVEEIDLKYKDQYTASVNYELEIKNYLKKGTLEFSKTDLTTGKPIADTKIEIYTDEDHLVFSGITDKDGKIIVSNLFIGKFYIIETEATTGYRLSNEKVYFEILENKEVAKASMTNEKFKGTLEFSKVDVSTGEPLPNTTIQIFTENEELIYEGVTDDLGKIIIPELEYGRYYILETTAPVGYTINPARMYFEIKEDGEIVKATMSDEKVVIDVPITESNKDQNIYTIGIAFIILGLGATIYVKRNKR